MDNSESIKQLYLDTEIKHKNDIDKIKSALQDLLDFSYADNLLDAMNYTNATYNILKLNYLTMYISFYLQEKKIVQNQSIPVNTSLKLLLEQDWINNNTKEFLKKHFKESITQNIEYSQYLKDIDTYLENAHMFR